MDYEAKIRDMVAATERTYQCVMVDGAWHLTQEQAAPPSIVVGGAWTVCGPWAEFKRGYERRRPTCPVCVRQAELFEQRHGASEAPKRPTRTAR